jgi:hypothetical protein
MSASRHFRTRPWLRGHERYGAPVEQLTAHAFDGRVRAVVSRPRHRPAPCGADKMADAGILGRALWDSRVLAYPSICRKRER